MPGKDSISRASTGASAMASAAGVTEQAGQTAGLPCSKVEAMRGYPSTLKVMLWR